MLFADELDMLECRLRELDRYPIWRHVIVEAATTHRGQSKPLYFAEHRERFAPWADRIVHVVADLSAPDPFSRVEQQREQTSAGLTEAGGDDVLLVADVDEIPSAAGMSAVAAANGRGVALEMVGCFFAVDWLWPAPVRTSVALPVRSLTTFTRARTRADATLVAVDAGHHLTWLGGPSAVRAKMAAHCHTEVHHRDLPKVWARGGVPFPAWTREPLIPVDVDERWPTWVASRQCPPSWFRPRQGV